MLGIRGNHVMCVVSVWRWCAVLLCCTGLWSWLHPETLSQASAVNLRRFIGCAVREFTFLARKPGCGGLHITTDACWGRCETWEVRAERGRESYAVRLERSVRNQ